MITYVDFTKKDNASSVVQISLL
uniref:Uncharacterized protein n=1 Tax=Arundo donax TaxID=35708 RepID=A0A0A8YU61_ARUDO